MTTTYPLDVPAPSSPPLVVFPFGEPDPRLEDYLDDKLQSTADLDTLDALLARVQVQHTQLQEQLDDAARDLDRAREDAAQKQQSLDAAVAEFDGLEATIAHRLGVANADNAAPEAVVGRLHAPMAQLHRVTLAHDYLVLLQDVGGWAAAARAALPASPREALAPYTRVRRLAKRLAELQSSEDVGAPHLVAHVGAVADGLWAEMNATMRASFAELLDARGWSAGTVDPAVRADETWRDGFAELLDLQVPEILAAAAAADTHSPSGPIVLFPISVMAEIFTKEFRYHFLSDSRKTSEPRQIGQVCFPWFIKRVEMWADFLRSSFADLLADRFEGTAAANSLVYVDPACALVAALLPVMREKVQYTADFAVAQLQQQRRLQREQQQQQQQQQQPSTKQQQGIEQDETILLNAPTFLGSFIVQLLSFDDDLRKRFGYDGGALSLAPPPGPPAAASASSSLSTPFSFSSPSWPGLSAEVLDSHFSLWLQAEKEYALSRYRDIVDGNAPAAQEARATIDYDYAVRGQTKPTLAAERVVDLLRAVTAQYRLVPKFGHRRRFLIDIQITLLDAYLERLQGSLAVYKAMTSTFGRTLHGFTKEQLAALEGTGALEALCRVYGSADLVANTLRSWGDDAFFVVLWDELQARARLGEGAGVDAGADVGPDAIPDAMPVASKKHDDDSLFDETIKSYAACRAAAESFLVTALTESHRKSLRPYVLRTQWTTQVDDVADEKGAEDGADSNDSNDNVLNDTVSPELDEPLRVMQRNLAFLSNALGTAPLRRIVRESLEALQNHLWSDVLMARKFTGAGAAQYARDIAAITTVVEREVPMGSAVALEWLRQGVRLLNLPVRVKLASSSSSSASGPERTTLREANELVFKDNPSARKLLKQLRLTKLTEASARDILKRRVEIEA